MEKLWEFRILYNAEARNCAMNNYHYYMAETAEDALKFHRHTLNHYHTTAQDISIEKYNPYSKKWEDQSEWIS